MGSALGTIGPYTVQHILNAAAGTTGTELVLQTMTPGVLGTIGGVSAYQVFTPAAGSIVVTLHTFTTAGSGATGTATSTTQAGLSTVKDLDVFVDVTASTGAATNSLLLFIDGRIDGTNFVNVAQFTIITAVGQAVAHLTKRNPAGAVAAVSTDAGVGTVRAIGFGDAIRVRRQITGTATTTFTGAVYITNILA